MTEIEQLNRHLGDSLGRVCGGTQPRFQWMFSSDMPYWRTRMEPVWVMCYWRTPVMSEAQWAKYFGGSVPYPTRGMYHPYGNLRVPQGMLPTAAMTAKFIRAADAQMSRTYAQELSAVNDEMAADKAAFDLEWTEKVQDQGPAFGNWDYGNRGGNISFGGI